MTKRWVQFLLFLPPAVTFIGGVYGAYRLRVDPSFAPHLPAVTFYLLAGVATSLMLEVIVRRFSAESDVAERVTAAVDRIQTMSAAGLETVPRNEDRIASFLNVTEDADATVAVLGVGFTNVSSRRGIEELRTLIDRVSVRLLLPDPSFLRQHTALRNAIEQALDRKSDIAGEIEGAISEFKKLHDSLPARRQERFQVRMHKTIPTMNLKVVDHGMAAARMLVEFFPYRCAFQGRLRLRLTPTRAQRGWYDHLAQAFEDLWDDSTPAF